MPLPKNFYEQVYQVVRLIPPGRVTSYGAIARYLGAGLSARVVGWAMKAGLREPHLPAHRVLNAQGLLSGKMHFMPPESMQQQLELEGIVVKQDQVLDFRSYFWDPSAELDSNL